MAICGTCGRPTESGDEVCLDCSEYATSLVGAYSAPATRTGSSSPGGYDGRGLDRYAAAGLVGHDHAEPQFASLSHFERPFAAEGTIWPDSFEFVPSQPEVGAPDVDADVDQRPSDQHDLDTRAAGQQRELEPDYLEQDDAAPPDPARQDQEQAAALPGLQPLTEVTGDQTAEPDQLAADAHGGRWIALTTASAVVIVAAAGAVTLAMGHDRGHHGVRQSEPSAVARPSANPSAAGQNQLIVDQAAATAPDAGAIATSLSRYFDAINSHEYVMYKRTFVLWLRGRISAESFSAGFGDTADSSEQLHSIRVLAGGQAEAFVTFVSQQASAATSGSRTCTVWRAQFFLGRRAGRYLLVATPLRSEASTMSCP